MLKKTLITIILLSFLALIVTPALALDPEQGKTTKTVDKGSRLKAHGWPVEFTWVDVECFKVPVYFKIAMYIEFPNEKAVKDKGIELKQHSISEYRGYSDPIEVLCNVNIKVGAKLDWVDAAGAPCAWDDSLAKQIQSDSGKWQARIRNSASWGDAEEAVAATGPSPAAIKYIVVRLRDPSLLKFPFDSSKPKKHVANAIVRVKPDFEAQWDP